LRISGVGGPEIVPRGYVGLAIDKTHVDEEFSAADKAGLDAESSVGAGGNHVGNGIAIIDRLQGSQAVPRRQRRRSVCEHQRIAPASLAHSGACPSVCWRVVPIAEL